MAFKPSKYQQAIFREIKNGTGNIVVNAVAGGGKTSTIIESLKLIPQGKRVTFLAFNKSIVQELQSRVPVHLQSSVRTLHSLGWGLLLDSLSNKPKLNQYKIKDLINKVLKDYINSSVDESDRGLYAIKIAKLVDLARMTLSLSEPALRNIAYDHNIDVSNGEVAQALNILHLANSDNTQFDFADMIYQPYHRKLVRRTEDFVFIDEAQDLNAAQHYIVTSLAKKTGRIVAVGDKNQAIYFFSGADAESFQKFVDMPNTKLLPLSVSYRCPKKVIELAKRYVPEIEAHEDAIDGEVLTQNFLDVDAVQPGDFVLCRTNAPLISEYFKFIKSGRRAKIRGNDIGKNLISIIKKTKAHTITELYDFLDDFKTTETLNLTKTRRSHSLETALQILDDKIDTIKVIASKYNSIPEVIEGIEMIFSDEQGDWIILSTCHKAKGLESDHVYIVRPDLMPLKNATGKQLQQEYNLAYVAYTRAKKKLVIVDENT